MYVRSLQFLMKLNMGCKKGGMYLFMLLSLHFGYAIGAIVSS